MRAGRVPETPHGAVGRGAAQEVVDRMVAGLGGTACAVERVLARTEGGLVDSEYGSEDEPDESNPIALQSVSHSILSI